MTGNRNIMDKIKFALPIQHIKSNLCLSQRSYIFLMWNQHHFVLEEKDSTERGAEHRKSLVICCHLAAVKSKTSKKIYLWQHFIALESHTSLESRAYAGAVGTLLPADSSTGNNIFYHSFTFHLFVITPCQSFLRQVQLSLCFMTSSRKLQKVIL